MQMPPGPFCQSCAMPMDAPDKFGTNVDNTPSDQYCVYCYQNGSFTQPDVSLAEMIEFCAAIMVEKMGMSREEAKAQLSQFMPMLARWRGKAQG